MTDLIERLRAKWRAAPVLGGGSLNGPCYIRDDGMRLRNPDGPEAADEIAALRERVAELEEALRAITLSGIHRDIKWAGMNAHDIARFALSKQDPEYSGWVEVVEDGE